MRAIGYVRVSTEEQSLQGVSLSNQAQKIQAYCMAKDWELAAVIRDEGCSGKDLNRPGIQEILKGCRKRAFDVVVTMKLDRLTRSVKDLGYLVEDVFNKHGVAFSSLQDNFDTSTANGRMVMNILATLAQWERDIISERTPNQDEMGTIQRLVEMKGQGTSYQRIAGQLNADAIPAKHGGRWHPKTVMGVLRYIQSLPGDHLVMRHYFPEGVKINGKHR
jgi:site-specific DNA recombinase